MASHPARVFISYAHSSPQHKQLVAELVNTLREAGVDVAVDADVRTPQGPPEGWPKWMKRQLNEADWVLMFFDELYRRRFDGEEEPDKGLGATWEGLIITHQFYRESGMNKRFIPLLADDASTRLIPDELVGANYYRIPKQSSELGDALIQAGETCTETPGTDLTRSVTRTYHQIAPTRLRHGAEHLFGREKELAALDRAWDDPGTHVFTIVAWGGVGKTSLVVEWMARKAKAGWPGFARVFDWSFYTQGTREEGAASADSFIAEALKFFGDEALAKSPASPWDKGSRLARLVAEKRTLLVLDGLDPLQYPPGPLSGQLKDPALEALLKGLAQQNPGLCLVTTRESVADLAPYRDTTAPQWDLEYLSEEAGAALLHQAGANRAGAGAIRPDDAELRAASREVLGHALTLHLLGTYLAKAHHGDIRKRDRVRFEEADAKVKGGHAFKVMAAYEKWLAGAGEKGRRQLAVLRMMGLFDRPADPGCIAALREAPAISGLTDTIAGVKEEDWNLTVSAMEEAWLVQRTPRGPQRVRGYSEEQARRVMEAHASGYELPSEAAEFVSPGVHDGEALEAHPLVREYFGKRLREEGPTAWREGHRRMYEHLKASVPYWPEGLEGLTPLYQAVAHGCQAGLHQDALLNVYIARILRATGTGGSYRKGGFYSSRTLGAHGADLGAVACFFELPWHCLAPSLAETHQAWLLHEAGFALWALGRLTEALEPMRRGLEIGVKQEVWSSAARSGNNLSEGELTLGMVGEAVRDAEESVSFADRSGDKFLRMVLRTALADALHAAGRSDKAMKLFREAEGMQARDQPQRPLLYSTRGFQYCDLLLAAVERAAWARILKPKYEISKRTCLKSCREVEQRARKTVKIADRENWLLEMALDRLTLGRAALYRLVLERSDVRDAKSEIEQAVDELLRASTQGHIPRGLLSRAWLRFVEGDADGARADLDEAWQIAERGPMRLFMADIHLYRARLFHTVTPYPWKGAKDDLAAARKLIEECGYHRRDEELADAEKALA